MATYLLKADDESMARWKVVAKERGYTFAEFVRACIETQVDGSASPLPSVAPDLFVRPVPPTSGKSSYEPDFKPESTRKKK